jgi:hypothetical protein
VLFPKLDLCDNTDLLERFLSVLVLYDKADLLGGSEAPAYWFQKLLDLSDKPDLLGGSEAPASVAKLS